MTHDKQTGHELAVNEFTTFVLGTGVLGSLTAGRCMYVISTVMCYMVLEQCWQTYMGLWLDTINLGTAASWLILGTAAVVEVSGICCGASPD